jgi:hypothetical protein
MTRLVARLVLAMLCLPIAAVLFVMLFVFAVALFPTANGPPSLAAIALAWSVVYAFIAAYWVWLWAGVIKWTPRRRMLTFAAVPAAVSVGLALGLTLDWLFGRRGAPIEIIFAFSAAIPPGVWMLLTVIVWRETRDERAARLAATGADTLACPVCAYNMTGMHSSDCPECGARFTIDQLIAAQSHTDAAILPRA